MHCLPINAVKRRCRNMQLIASPVEKPHRFVDGILANCHIPGAIA